MSTISNTALPREAHVGTFFRAVGKTIGNWWIAYINWRLEQLAISTLAVDERSRTQGHRRSPRCDRIRWSKGADRHPMLNRLTLNWCGPRKA